MLKKFKNLSYLFIIILLVVGCGESNQSKHKVDYKKPISWGQSNLINTFANHKIWEYGKLKLQQSLEREFFTTNNENLFTIKKRKIYKIKHYYKFANLLFFCNLNSDDEVSTYVKKILPESSLTIEDTIGYRIIPTQNFWARQQTVVFIIGNNTKKTLLPLYTPSESNRLFKIFEQREKKKLERIAYRPGLNEKEIAYEKKHYPWSLKLPAGFIVFKRDNKNNFVSYLLRVKDYPDRFLSIYWEPMQKDAVSKEWLWQKRLEIGDKYFVGDEFTDQDVTQKRIVFNGHEGYKLWGRWQNFSNYTGGTFASVAFYDAEQKMAYLIDNAVFFPSGDKLRALMKLAIISQTLQLDQLSTGIQKTNKP